MWLGSPPRQREARERRLKINGVWQDHLTFAKIANEHVPQFFVSAP